MAQFHGPEEAIQQKNPTDNAKSWQCKAAQNKDWDGHPARAWVHGFLHLPYSPDLAPADYHFLQSMVNEISNRILENKKSL